MTHFLITEILRPLARRAGTLASGFLAGALALDPGLAEQTAVVVTGILTAAVAVGIELVFSHEARKDDK